MASELEKCVSLAFICSVLDAEIVKSLCLEGEIRDRYQRQRETMSFTEF